MDANIEYVGSSKPLSGKKDASPYHQGLDFINLSSPKEEIVRAIKMLHQLQEVPTWVENKNEAVERLTKQDAELIFGVIDVLQEQGKLNKVRDFLLHPPFNVPYEHLPVQEEQQILEQYHQKFDKDYLTKEGARVLLSLISGLPLSHIKYLTAGGTKYAFALYGEKGQRSVIREYGSWFHPLAWRINAKQAIMNEPHASSIAGELFASRSRNVPFLPMDIAEYVPTEWEAQRLAPLEQFPDFWKAVKKSKKGNPILMRRGDDWGFAIRTFEGNEGLFPVTIDFSHLSYLPGIETYDGSDLADVTKKAHPEPIPLELCPPKLINFIRTTQGVDRQKI